jgi:hypothetical protein
MEYELISQNSDMALACERARSSLIDPLLTPSAAAPLRVRINRRFDSLLCQGPGILMTDILFPDILFWEVREVVQGAFSGDFRKCPVLMVPDRLDASIGKLQFRPTCRSRHQRTLANVRRRFC